MGSKDHEELCFHKLLCAIHTRPYQIPSVAELATITNIADYHQALPVLSSTIYAAMLKTSNFYSAILKDPCSVLTSARTLRNDILFKDSLLFSLGPRSNPIFLKLSDPELFKLATTSYARICVKIVKAQPALLSRMQKPPIPSGYHPDDHHQELGERLAGSIFQCGSGFLLPVYYHKYFESQLDSKE
jgi:hypothetical protein